FKALAKSPHQRYDSATDMAQDLRNWLDGRPILARPVGPVGRLGRFCRRRPLVSTLALLLALTVVGGFIGMTLLYMQAANAEVAEREQRNRAEEHLETARQAVDTFFVQLYEKKLLDGIENHELARPVLEEARRFYQSMLQRETQDPRLRANAADSAFRLGW